MPTISIIMTVFNREEYLQVAIASILAQTYTNFELIIWDDGSSDRSIEIAKKYADADDRINFVAHNHIGRIPSLIEAKKQATGKYLALVDSDDYLSPNCLEATVAVLEQKLHIGMVYTGCHLVSREGKTLSWRQQNYIPYSRDRLLTNFITFHFRMYRAELFRQVGGYDLKQEYCEDYDLALKLSEITEVEFVPQATYYYRQHAQTQGAKLRVERIYWTKKAIKNSMARTNDPRSIKVEIPRARFVLSP